MKGYFPPFCYLPSSPKSQEMIPGGPAVWTELPLQLLWQTLHVILHRVQCLLYVRGSLVQESHKPLHMGDAADSLLVNVKFTCCLEISIVPGNSSPPWKIRRNCLAGGPVAQNALFSVVIRCDYTVRTTEGGLAWAINILPQPAATLR